MLQNKTQHNQVRNVLFYDKRSGGSRGRALVEGIPTLGVAKGDRLEPSELLPDIALFDAISNFHRRSYLGLSKVRAGHTTEIPSSTMDWGLGPRPWESMACTRSTSACTRSSSVKCGGRSS